MTAIRRMPVLEQEAGSILRNRGYEPVIMGKYIRSSRHIPSNLIAHKELDDGTIDSVIVTLKISLHPITSPDEAMIFCREELKCMKKISHQVPADVNHTRLEVWISIPSNTFLIFEITRDGIREVLLAEELSRQETGGTA